MKKLEEAKKVADDLAKEKANNAEAERRRKALESGKKFLEKITSNVHDAKKDEENRARSE